ncbi:F0F1 ATP synthase subunit B family protein [Desulfoplanes sp.]
MLIDPFTVFVQVLNFLILILVLKRFLFGPITRAVAKRETRIAEELESARKARETAERDQKDMEDERARLREEEKHMFQEVKDRAATLENELTASAKSAVRSRERAFIQSFEREKIRRADELQREMASHLFAMTNNALQDLANLSLHASMVTHFLDTLEKEAGSPDDRFRNLFSGQDNLNVSTPLALPEAAKKRLGSILEKKCGFRGEIIVHDAPQLLAGLSLEGNGHRMDWTIHRYLKDLKSGLLEQES